MNFIDYHDFGIIKLILNYEKNQKHDFGGRDGGGGGWNVVFDLVNLNCPWQMQFEARLSNQKCLFERIETKL